MILVPLDTSAHLRDAIVQIEAARRGIAVVCDADGKILGTVTDGDVRRAILRGADLDTPLVSAMNDRPLTAQDSMSDHELVALLNNRGLEAIPLVDAAERFQRIAHLRDLVPEARERGGAEELVAAVVMAGGEGQRLRPLTEKIPKPMVEVGGMPLVERHVRHIARAGIRHTFLAVNYLAEKIENHIAETGPYDTKIDFLREDRKMGTAGALSLLPDLPDGPILVLNSDVVHSADYGNLLQFHQTRDADLTIAAVEHRVQIPYGVLQSRDGVLTAIEEKPSQRFMCNAGLYVLGTAARSFIAQNRAVDMTDVIDELLSTGRNIAVFPVHEYWADIGDSDDLARVRNEIWKLDGAYDT